MNGNHWQTGGMEDVTFFLAFDALSQTCLPLGQQYPPLNRKPDLGYRFLISPGGRGQLVGSAVPMIRAIVTSLPVKRGILLSFENGADDFAASNDFFFQPSCGWGLFSY